MPEMTPVANQVNPPDPLKGINTFSSILRLKQQQQNLETGAYEQQTAQATASQASQKDRELQAAQQLVFNGAKSGAYTGSDGSLNRQKLSDDLLRVAPTYGGEISSRMLSQANEIVANQQAHQSLSQDQQKQMGSTFGALATKPDLSNSDFVDALNTLTDQNKDPQFKRMAMSMLTHLPPAADTKQLREVARRWSIAATSPSDATGQTTPAPSAMQGPKGLQIINTNPQAVGGVGPAGPPQRQGLAPTEQIPYRRAAAAAGVEGGAGAGNDEALYNEIQQKGSKATQIKSLSQDIQNLSREVQTGQYSKAFADKWSVVAQTLGFPAGAMDTATRRQILSKMAAQLKMQAEGGASTDAERDGVRAALPDPEHMNPEAVSQAARYVGAQADVNAARARFANQHRSVNGGTSTGLRQTDQAFMQSADPRVFEYQQIPAGAARQAYLRQHFTSKEQVQEFLSKQQAMKGYGAVQ